MTGLPLIIMVAKQIEFLGLCEESIMNREEWEVIVNGVIEFNRLIHSDIERCSEEYYVKSCNLVDEEYGKEFLPHLEEWYTGSTTNELKIKLLDDVCDTLVVGIQATEINTPSSLDWDYIDCLYAGGNWTKHKDIFIKPMLEVMECSDLLGFELFGAMCEVIRSNNTKIPTLDQVMQYYGTGELYESSVDDACHSAADWIESQLGYEFDITWNIIIDSDGVDRVIFRDQNKKLRKPWCFEEPQLEKYL